MARSGESVRIYFIFTYLIGISSGLVEKDEIGDLVGDASFDQVVDLVSASIQPLGIGQQQLDLLGELFEAGRRVPRRRHHDLRIRHSRPTVFVVLMRSHTFAALK